MHTSDEVPDRYTLKLDFGSQGTFDYTVPTVKFLEITAEELNRKNMVLLIPFYLLKLRKSIEKERTPENLEALKSLILNDIIGSINRNLEAGNITPGDAGRLRQLTFILYRHLYSHYEEMEAVNDMTDESLILDIDIYEEKLERAEEEKQQLREKNQGLTEENQQQRNLIEELRRELEELKSRQA